MQSFKNFLNERSNRIPFSTRTKRTGNLGLPDLVNLDDPQDANKGLATSFKDLVQRTQDASNMKDSDLYSDVKLLEKLGKLAENIASAIILKYQSVHVNYYRYDSAEWDPDPSKNLMTNIQSKGVFGEGYMKLDDSELNIAKSWKIITVTTNGFFNLDVGMLEDKMLETRNKLRSMNNSAINWQKIGGFADDTLSNALTSSNTYKDYTKAT